MKHYKLSVVMASRPMWEMPLGQHESLGAAINHAGEMASRLEWGYFHQLNQTQLEKLNEKPFVAISYEGVLRFFDTPMEAVEYLYANAPDFTEVKAVVVTQGEACQPKEES